MNATQFDVVSVGGGFSGTMLAIQLLYRAPALKIAVLEKASSPGRGVAYGTSYRCHLLNLPAESMSAFAEEPEHFLRWARANYEPSLQGRSFLPRALYGRYMESLLRHAAATAPAESFTWIEDEALSLTRRDGAFVLQTKNGPDLHARAVVIATGTYPPSNPKVPGLSSTSCHYVSYPWSTMALDDLPIDGSVLLLGAGLTSMDLAVALKSRGFKGQIHILSRLGSLPQAQQTSDGWGEFWGQNWPATISAWMRLIRAEVEKASAAGHDWRAVIDALRPITPQIWQKLSLQERRRFLRHVRPYWELHRHRAAPEIADMVSDLIEDGQVCVYAGKPVRYRDHENLAEVVFSQGKEGSLKTLLVNRVINCTGSETDCRRIEDPLVTSLFVQGFARPDPLFMGLEVDPNGALLSADGRPSDWLFALGPPRKGCLWETTAVPEIRAQAAQLSEHLLHVLIRRPRRRRTLAVATNVGMAVL